MPYTLLSFEGIGLHEGQTTARLVVRQRPEHHTGRRRPKIAVLTPMTSASVEEGGRGETGRSAKGADGEEDVTHHFRSLT